jgi:uncharacterized repeat protein (TIGR03803 family)
MNYTKLLTGAVIAVTAGCATNVNTGSTIPAVGNAAHERASHRQAHGVNFTVITAFQSGKIQHPLASVTFDAAGNLYGTGMNGISPDTYGGVFKVDTSGNETDFYAFDGTNATQPEAAVTFDAGGNLYGATIDGVYTIAPSGDESEIEALDGGPEGGYSFSNLVRDAAGNFYGTASEGGYFRGQCAPLYVGCGVVFKVTPSGRYEVIHEFRETDGSTPYAGVIIGGDGNLYGTTGFGGSLGWGTVFSMTPSGKIHVLYNFAKSQDGGVPRASVIQDTSGNLYGTTQYGGFNGNRTCDNGCGVVFKISAGGKESTLHAFTSVPDGAFPLASLYLDSSGNLYGTTQQGGSGVGSVFELNTSGKHYRVLHRFTDGSDGAFPAAGLVPDSAGNLYGTAEGGGIGAGTVFKISP